MSSDQPGYDYKSPWDTGPGQFRSRARAGTMPSRLNVVSPPFTQPLGSLALLSPDNDHMPQQQPQQQHQLHQVHQHQHHLSTNVTPIGSRSPSLLASQSFSSLPDASSRVSRLRSGSMSKLDNPNHTGMLGSSSSGSGPGNAFSSPFGPSIWASREESQVASSASSINSVNVADDDPMKPFLKELNVRTDLSRMRSYTVAEDDLIAQQHLQHHQAQLRPQMVPSHPPPPHIQGPPPQAQSGLVGAPSLLQSQLLQQQLMGRPRAQTTSTYETLRPKLAPPSRLQHQYSFDEDSELVSQMGHVNLGQVPMNQGQYHQVHPMQGQMQHAQQMQQMQQVQMPQIQGQPMGQSMGQGALPGQAPLQTQGQSSMPVPIHNQSQSQPQSHGQAQASQSLPTQHAATHATRHSPQSNVTPSRSLWLGNVPPSTTSYTLHGLFNPFGVVESARVLPHKNCGFVDFATVESAYQAIAALNGKELFPGAGPCKVGFAKAVPVSERVDEDDDENGVRYSVSDNADGSSGGVPGLAELAPEINRLALALAPNGSINPSMVSSAINRALQFNQFTSQLGSIPEPQVDRIYDAPTLRDVRKRVDSGLCSQQEVDEMALDMLDEVAELASDYVGNTVVQKLFDYCSPVVKDMMLRRIAPYLAQIGTHKNGTWAAQKIIDVTTTARGVHMIAQALRKNTVHLFLDQFGNYVIQCCLKFGSPWNDFIFETMLSQFWPIAQGRFGARAMRACLESNYASPELLQMLAADIALHSVQLATNVNGALLLSWYLDTCMLPNRHQVCAPVLITSLVALCTHKLASLTVLKIVNYNSLEARQQILQALFGFDDSAPDLSSTALMQILADTTNGTMFVFKLISSPSMAFNERQVLVAKIRAVLIALKALPSQGYKRLMDEVGLATRSGSQNGPQRSASFRRNNPPAPAPAGAMAHASGGLAPMAQGQYKSIPYQGPPDDDYYYG